MKRCHFCGGEIRGRSVKVWSQFITEPGTPPAPVTYHDAHPDCAAMLDDDDEEEEDDDDE